MSLFIFENILESVLPHEDKMWKIICFDYDGCSAKYSVLPTNICYLAGNVGSYVFKFPGNRYEYWHGCGLDHYYESVTIAWNGFAVL